MCRLCTTWQLLVSRIDLEAIISPLFGTAKFLSPVPLKELERLVIQLGMYVFCAEQSPDAEAVAAGRLRSLHCAIA